MAHPGGGNNQKWCALCWECALESPQYYWKQVAKDIKKKDKDKGPVQGRDNHDDKQPNDESAIQQWAIGVKESKSSPS